MSKVVTDRVKTILKNYEYGSGQMINFDKSALFFSSNTPTEDKEEIKNIFAIQAVSNPEKYLGLPTLVGKEKKKAFRTLKERLQSKLANWSNRCLSVGGKETLIKSVLQAVPTYAMSVFLLPKTLCEELDRMIRNYWWKCDSKSRGIHWLNWTKMCRTKSEGGVGFRKMEAFNKAMLCKQGWRLLSDTNTLAHHVLKAKYFPNTNFLNSYLGSHPSLTWRSIWGTKEFLERGTRWRVGDGSKIEIWTDKWLPTKEPFKVLSPPSPSLTPNKVEELIEKESRCWKHELIHRTFSKEEADTICSLPLSIAGGTDIIVWHYDNKGKYNVRSGYKLLCKLPAVEDNDLPIDPAPTETRVWDLIWKANAPTKIRLFAWKAMHNILPTFDNLSKRSIAVDRQCPRCFGHDETALHVLRDCPFADGVWGLINFSKERSDREQDSIQNWMQRVITKSSQETLQWFLITIWALWNARNDFTHGESSRSMKDVSIFAGSYVQEFNEAQISEARHDFAGSRRWQPPPEGMFKINFDGGLNPSNREGGIGFVIRDFRGMVFGAAAMKIRNVADSFSIEALAALRALDFAKGFGFSNVIVEGDALCIMKKLSTEEPDFSPIGPIIDDARRCIRQFAHCVFSHVPRSCNSVAHLFAKRSFLCFHDMFWFEDCPDWAVSLVVDDFPVFNE